MEFLRRGEETEQKNIWRNKDWKISKFDESYNLEIQRIQGMSSTRKWGKLYQRTSQSICSKPLIRRKSWDFPVVQWLRFHLPVQGTQVPSMVRPYIPLGQKSKHVLQKNSIKTLKMVHQKKKKENFKSKQREKRHFL